MTRKEAHRTREKRGTHGHHDKKGKERMDKVHGCPKGGTKKSKGHGGLNSASRAKKTARHRKVTSGDSRRTRGVGIEG